VSTTPKIHRTTHTPGPWKADRMGCFIFAHDGQMPVCETRGWGYLTGFEKRDDDDATAIQKANAQLIATAPDYHKAAREIVGRHDTHAVACNFDRCGCDDCKPFRALIAKAEGR
jgi:hypothetical protein